MTLEAKIESVLFWKAEPMLVSRLAKIFSTTPEEINISLAVLEDNLKGRGVTLLYKDDEVALRTSPDASDVIENLTKEELTRDLGKAGLETLSIVLYQGPISRREIDYIRGVNSNFILRNLLVRGLVEKIENPKDLRSYLYRATFDLLSHLGVARIEDLPEYVSTRKEVDTFVETSSEAATDALSESLIEEIHEE
ncbi:MAG: SMC-Scp complex subunit ScpB [Candidatus Taylorbacteria bacterium]|nr:SMC-Scp complex subunit ScpB [Candidatus Taylorbacteria bacterium]